MVCLRLHYILAYKSTRVKVDLKKYLAKIVQNWQIILCVENRISSFYCTNNLKTINSEIPFYDPRISRIGKIFPKFCPKFLDLYASIYCKFLKVEWEKFLRLRVWVYQSVYVSQNIYHFCHSYSNFPASEACQDFFSLFFFVVEKKFKRHETEWFSLNPIKIKNQFSNTKFIWEKFNKFWTILKPIFSYFDFFASQKRLSPTFNHFFDVSDVPIWYGFNKMYNDRQFLNKKVCFDLYADRFVFEC